jgi:DNA-binding transcriptional regulator of glucitol operon
VRALLSPKWLLLHVLAVVAALVMLRLGWWQWGRGKDTGSIRSYSYGVEWVLFALLTGFGYTKFALDEQRPADPEPPRPAPVVPAQAAGGDDDDDPELAAYNRHLAWLARNPRR